MRPEYSQAHGGAGGAGAASAPTRVRPQLGPRSAPAGPATPPGTEAPPCSSPIVPARRRYVTAATPTWGGPRRFSEICGLLRLVTALETVNSHSPFVFSLIAHKMTAFCAPRRAPPRRPERPLYSWSFVGILLTALVLLLPTPSGRALEQVCAPGGELERVVDPSGRREPRAVGALLGGSGKRHAARSTPLVPSWGEGVARDTPCGAVRASRGVGTM